MRDKKGCKGWALPPSTHDRMGRQSLQGKESVIPPNSTLQSLPGLAAADGATRSTGLGVSGFAAGAGAGAAGGG